MQLEVGMTRIKRNVRSMPMIYVRCINSGKVYPARIRSWCTVSKGRGKGSCVSYSVVVYGTGRDAWETICSGKYALFRFVHTSDLIKLLTLVKHTQEAQLDSSQS